MGDPFGSYPLSEQQGALFQRNPVCSLCYRVCAKQSKRRGGMNFPIIRCLEEADSLCEQIICKVWNLPSIDQIYHWLDSRLNGCQLSVSCTVATVCVTLNCIEELPEQARELTDDLLGLLSDNGHNLYDTLNSEACRLSINISAATYGLPPPKPDTLIQIEQLQQENTRLTKHNKQLEKTIKSMEQDQQTRVAPIIKVAGDYIDIHDNHNCNIYATDRPSSTSSETIVPPVGKEPDSVPSSFAAPSPSSPAASENSQSPSSFIFSKKAKREAKESTIIEALQHSVQGRRDKTRAFVDELHFWQKEQYVDAYYNAKVMYDELKKIIPLSFGYETFKKYYNNTI